MNVSVAPGGRLLEDDEHAVVRWISAQGEILRAVFERDGDAAVFQFVVRETATSDVPLEVGLDAVPQTFVEQLDQRGYDVTVPEADDAQAEAAADSDADAAEVFE